ncbi:MAG TPA: rhodanese-like domain-containing protein [Thermoanaerobaculia bacterium]|nr:rhodanese-like domain-containing protein [Thermoanaerobaculia bacterium]
MKHLLIAAAAATSIAVVADAQYKTPQPATPGTVQITPAAPGTSVVQDELATARRISRDQAMKMVKEKKAVYVDVRSKDTFDLGHLPGAINIPLSQFQQRFKDLPLNKFLITYCA